MRPPATAPMSIAENVASGISVAERVVPDDAPLGDALGARGAHVVGVQRLEHARAHVSAVDGDLLHRQRERGQDEMFDAVDDVEAGGRRRIDASDERQQRRARMEVRLVERADEHDGDEAEEERRHREPEEREPGRRVVEPRVLLHGRDHADPDADDDVEDRGERAEHERVRQRGAQRRPHRALRRVRRPEVAAEEVAEEHPVLLEQRLVEPEVVLELDQARRSRRCGGSRP